MPAEIPNLSISWGDAAHKDLVLRFILDAAATPAQIDGLARLVAAFTAVGENGGYSGEMNSPADSSLILVYADHSLLTRPTFQLTAKNLDIRAFQLIRHLSWRWAANAQAVRSIEVVERMSQSRSSTAHLPPATWGAEDAAYPPLSKRMSIQIDRDDPADYQKERRCVIDLGGKISSEIFGSLIDRVRKWVELVEHGAYGPPVKPAFESEVWQENLAPYDEGSVELCLSLFEASEFAWNPLLNSLEHYSRTHQPIVTVTVE